MHLKAVQAARVNRRPREQRDKLVIEVFVCRLNQAVLLAKAGRGCCAENG